MSLSKIKHIVLVRIPTAPATPPSSMFFTTDK